MKKRSGIKIAAAVIAAVIIIIVIAVPIAGKAKADNAVETVQSITETVEKLALQCYVIEGAYPMSLDYLEENYGLTVNKEDYLIVYTPFAENLPPDIRVIKR